MPPVNEPLNVVEEPVYCIGTWWCGGGGEERGWAEGGWLINAERYWQMGNLLSITKSSHTHTHNTHTHTHTPKKELGIFILSHLWSFLSSPLLVAAIALATRLMDVAKVSFVTKSPGTMQTKGAHM